jgi:hypothetical protein
MVVVERYPELKSDQNFRDLQAQLEGTENRITVARNRYIAAVQDYNVTVRKFPTNLTAMIFGYKVKPNFTVENESVIAKPPTVDFGTTPAPAPEPHRRVIELTCARRAAAWARDRANVMRALSAEPGSADRGGPGRRVSRAVRRDARARAGFRSRSAAVLARDGSHGNPDGGPGRSARR